MPMGGGTHLRMAESVPAVARVRYEKRADIHEAFLSLGCALICWCYLRVAGGGLKVLFARMH
jgi:hypothetical protein